jgi:uncharacterized protein (DUF1330 family)
MSACVIGQITVRDPERWAEYRKRVPETLTPYGGVVLFRGARFAAFGGEHAHTDTVVVQFPDQAAVESWYRSAAYQELLPLREQAADVVLIAYQS